MEYLIMYDSGYLGVVTDWGDYEGESISPLDTKKYKMVIKESILKK